MKKVVKNASPLVISRKTPILTPEKCEIRVLPFRTLPEAFFPYAALYKKFWNPKNFRRFSNFEKFWANFWKFFRKFFGKILGQFFRFARFWEKFWPYRTNLTRKFSPYRTIFLGQKTLQTLPYPMFLHCRNVFSPLRVHPTTTPHTGLARLI